MTQEPTGASEPAAGTTRTLEVAGITLVYVPAGEFTMGSADDDPDATYSQKPQHKVRLDGFWIGQTEVTNAQYRQFIEAGGYSRREYWTTEGWQWKEQADVTQPSRWYDVRFNGPEQPVAGVSWYEADAYARWAGGRLPTEAEWEYAARGGPLSQGYLYAGSDDAGEVAWYDANSGRVTHAVGQKRANELGLYDMSGNVGEWCVDWHDLGYYSQSPAHNPQGPETGFERVERGGSWYLPPTLARCAARPRYDPDGSYYGRGFRVVVVA